MELQHSPELAIFARKSCLSGTEHSKILTRYLPISSPKCLGDSISFSIEKDSKNFTDLSRSYVVMRIQIIDKTTNLPYVSSATTSAAVVDNIRYSLVKSTSIELNKTKIGNPEAQPWIQKFLELYTEPSDFKQQEQAGFAGAEADDPGK